MRTLFIVEDEIIVAKDLERLLTQAGYSVVGMAQTYEKAIQKLTEASPDLILCDIHLNGPQDGLDLMTEIQAKTPIPFILISAYTDLPTLKRATGLQPEQYLTKPISESQLLTSIQLVFAKHLEQAPPTARELAVIRGIAQGLSTKAIAHELGITSHTVETHRKNLLRKYQVSTSPELIRLAASQNWLWPPRPAL